MSRRRERAQWVRRWYPAAWCERYGEELLDLLDDTFAEARLSVGARLSIVRAGIGERCREGGFAGNGSTPALRARAGSLSVLGAWALFVVAGSGFAKYSEHWDSFTPAASRAVPSTAMTVLQVSAYAGALLCVTAALLSGRSFARLGQRIGTRATLRLVRPGVLAAVVAASSSGVIIVVAHHLNALQRNGGSSWYQFVGLIWVSTLVVCLVVGLATVVRVVLRLDYSRREILSLSWLGGGVAVSMLVIFGSLLVWWVAIARSAGKFFSSSLMLIPATTVPLPMIAVAVTMLLGLLVASWGVSRTLRSVPGLRIRH